MFVYSSSLNGRGRRARLAQMIMVCTAALSGVAGAQTIESEAAPAPPYALFEYSTLTGSGNTITATWAPVVTASGTVYKTVTLLFNVDSTGNLTLAQGYPQVIKAPSILVSNFKAGNYVGPSAVFSGAALITVSGPGVTQGGATIWTLATSPGANVGTYPTSATWYVGALASNPLAPRLKAAGPTSQAYSYGIVGSSQYFEDGGVWGSGALIGLSQTGNQLNLVSFTTADGKDHNTSVGQITYTLKQ